MSTEPENYPTRKEHFDIVMLKNGTSETTCLPEDIKRVSVEAADPIAALQSDAAHEQGWRTLWTAVPGMLTDLEMMARQRVYSGGTTDPTKI